MCCGVNTAQSTHTMKPAQTGQRIAAMVARNGYTEEELELLFTHLGKLNLPDFTTGINAVVTAYVSNAEAITGPELTGLSYLCQFAQTLQKFNR